MLAWLASETGMWVVTALMVMPGLWFTMRGWIGHRAKGSPRCRKCFYSMVAATSLTCPECGRKHKKEIDLLRPRRFRKRLVVGLLILSLGLYLAFWPDVMQRRHREVGSEKWYIAAIPTTALIIALRCHHDYEMLELVNERMYGSYDKPDYVDTVWFSKGESAGDFFNETTMFRVKGELYRWQVRLLIDQAELLIRNREADDDEHVWYAVRWLVCAAYQDDAAFDGLMEALQLKGDPDLRADAVLGLGLLPGRDEQVIDGLVSLLDDDEMAVVGTAAMALSVRGDGRFRAAPKLVEIVKRSMGAAWGEYGYARNYSRWTDNAADNARKTLRSFGAAAVPLVLDELEQFDPWTDAPAPNIWWELYLAMDEDGVDALPRVAQWLQRPVKADAATALEIAERYEALIQAYGHHAVPFLVDHIVRLNAREDDHLQWAVTYTLQQITPSVRAVDDEVDVNNPDAIPNWHAPHKDRYWKQVVPVLVTYITRHDPHANIDQIYELLRLLVAIGPDARAAIEPLGKWLDDANVKAPFSLRTVYSELKRVATEKDKADSR